jgi:hypothetical protein
MVTRQAESPPSQAFEFLPELDLVVLYRTGPPSDAEWDAYVAAITDPSRATLPRCIVITEGGYPTHAQQARRVALARGRPSPRIAVISPAIAIGFVVSAFALNFKGMKTYSPAEHGEAFAHVDLAPLEWPGVEVVIERLRLTLASAARGTVSPLRRRSGARTPR